MKIPPKIYRLYSSTATTKVPAKNARGTCHCPLQLIRVRVLRKLHWAVYIIYKISNLVNACKYTLGKATYLCIENVWSHVALSDVQVANSVSWEKTAVAWALRVTFSMPLSHWENTENPLSSDIFKQCSYVQLMGQCFLKSITQYHTMRRSLSALPAICQPSVHF